MIIVKQNDHKEGPPRLVTSSVKWSGSQVLFTFTLHSRRATKHDTWCALREKAMEMVILFWGWVEKKRLVGKRLSGSHFPSCRQWRVSDFQINRGSWPGLKWSLICLMTKNCVAVLCHLQNYIHLKPILDTVLSLSEEWGASGLNGWWYILRCCCSQKVREWK